VFDRLKRFVLHAWHGFLRYAVKFGVVGLIGMVIDVSLFNALRLGAFGDHHFFQTAIGAKILSTSVAIIFNWIGNRLWTFRENRRQNVTLELVEYVLVSIGGLLIAVGCLWISHHLLGLTSLLADNIATNIIGLALGTAFRFFLYRYWVYGVHRPDGLHHVTARLAKDADDALIAHTESLSAKNGIPAP